MKALREVTRDGEVEDLFRAHRTAERVTNVGTLRSSYAGEDSLVSEVGDGKLGSRASASLLVATAAPSWPPQGRFQGSPRGGRVHKKPHLEDSPG